MTAPNTTTASPAIDNRIEGRLALVTGASGGIGAACARSLAALGCHLALTYSSSVDAIITLASELGSHYPHLRITTHVCDLTSTPSVVSLCPTVLSAHQTLASSLGHEESASPTSIDILVSNAGRGIRITDVWDIPVEEFDMTMNINVRAAFLLVKGVVEGMREKRWGRIVFVSSIAGYGAGVNGCHYAASKGGLIGMMKNLATRLGPYGITANDVAPAMIGETGMIPNAASVPGVVEQIPVGRLGTTEEVAEAVCLFVKAGYINGESLLISGGLKHL